MCWSSSSTTVGLKLKPIEQKEKHIVKNNFQKIRQRVTKLRIASVLESLIDTSEDDAEILDVSQNVKQDMAEPLDEFSFHEETDEDSNADEGLGCEIIDPKDIETSIDDTEQFSTKVRVLGKVSEK